MPILTTGAGAFLAASVAKTTFDLANKSSFITLSGGSLIATATAGAGGATNVRALASSGTGQRKCEFTITNNVAGIGIGLCNSTYAIGSGGGFLGGDVNSLCYYISGGEVYFNGSLVTTIATAGNGDVVTMEADLDADVVKFAVNGGSLSTAISLASQTLFPAVEIEVSGGVITANFGQSAYFRTPTSGYVDW